MNHERRCHPDIDGSRLSHFPTRRLSRFLMTKQSGLHYQSIYGEIGWFVRSLCGRRNGFHRNGPNWECDDDDDADAADANHHFNHHCQSTGSTFRARR